MVMPKRFLKTAFAWLTLPNPHSLIAWAIGPFDLRSRTASAARRCSEISSPTVTFPISRKRRSSSVRETPRCAATSCEQVVQDKYVLRFAGVGVFGEAVCGDEDEVKGLHRIRDDLESVQLVVDVLAILL